MTSLIDTSALILGVRDPRARAWLVEALADDAVVITDVVALEYLMGARNAEHHRALTSALDGFGRLTPDADDWRRAEEVLGLLASTGPGLQRSVRVPDLLIAAVAEHHGLPVVHYDEDYDRIAAVTGQPTTWILPRGTA